MLAEFCRLWDERCWVERCKGWIHMCYFNSRGNYTKVNRFSRIYTLTEGRRAWPRREREGRGQLEWAAQDFHVLTLGSEGLITDRNLCYTARAEGSGPWVLRGMWWRCPLYPWDWVHLGLNLQQRLGTQPQESLRYQLCTTGICVAKFFPEALPSKPLPLSLCPLLLESGKDSQDSDLNRQVVAKRETLCDQKTVQKSGFGFEGETNLLSGWGMPWQFRPRRGAQQSKGMGRARSPGWVDLQLLFEHSFSLYEELIRLN